MSGLELAHRFYEQRVRPLLADVPHAAGLLGPGSEVLGFDDATSRDHDFGPRGQVFTSRPDAARDALSGLSGEFEGQPVVFSCQDGAPAHHVEVSTAADFFTACLGADPGDGFTVEDWLLTPTQLLASLTAGAVFHDPDGELARRRQALRWYPHDVWRYALAAGWLKVGQEEPFVGRAGAAGDDLGSRIVALRVARELIRLTFLVERRWAPYAKWLARGFAQLSLGAKVRPLLSVVAGAVRWQERESALAAAASLIAAATNDLGLYPPVDPAPRRFHARDIHVLGAERFTVALTAAITDPQLRALLDRLGGRRGGPVGRLPGTIDQAVDSTDVLANPARFRQAGPLLGLGR